MLAALNDMAIRWDPSLILDELGMDPDDWQRQVLRSKSERMILNAHRQAGKSTATAGLAIWTALYHPGSLTLVVSASFDQAAELFRKMVGFYNHLGRPVPTVEDNAKTLALASGSRIVVLASNPATVRGYSAPQLILIDEAAQVDDEVFIAMAPMTLRSRGRVILLSTPHGMRGYFHSVWTSADDSWERILFRASDTHRMPPDPGYLAAQRMQLGDLGFRQEWQCEFLDADNQVFSTESVLAAFDPDLEPLFPEYATR